MGWPEPVIQTGAGLGSLNYTKSPFCMLVAEGENELCAAYYRGPDRGRTHAGHVSFARTLSPLGGKGGGIGGKRERGETDKTAPPLSRKSLHFSPAQLEHSAYRRNCQAYFKRGRVARALPPKVAARPRPFGFPAARLFLRSGPQARVCAAAGRGAPSFAAKSGREPRHAATFWSTALLT